MTDVLRLGVRMVLDDSDPDNLCIRRGDDDPMYEDSIPVTREQADALIDASTTWRIDPHDSCHQPCPVAGCPQSDHGAALHDRTRTDSTGRAIYRCRGCGRETGRMRG